MDGWLKRCIQDWLPEQWMDSYMDLNDGYCIHLIIKKRLLNDILTINTLSPCWSAWDPEVTWDTNTPIPCSKPIYKI